jgi:dTDP-4-dehydrorhamnose reductase
MNHLIIGASGFIGNNLYVLLKKMGKNVIGSYYSNPIKDLINLDMMSSDNLDQIFDDYHPKYVYMPAYIPNVEYCEENEEPNIINKKGTKNVVKFCEQYNSKLIFYSSDYIFDGKYGPYLETDKPNPLNKYGEDKLYGENEVKKLEDYLILRTTVVYGYDKSSKNFLMTFAKALLNGKTQKVPFDQIGSPTYVDDLSKITIKLVEAGCKGIYNVVGPDLCSRYVFALKIARFFGLNSDLIKPVSTLELQQNAKRPLRAGLIIDKIRKEIDAKPMHIDEALKDLKFYFKYSKT